jgi:hypothetical protein
VTFDEILDQVLALLQRRGRLTYRALQRQFNLDEADLADLRDEIIRGQRLAVDVGGASWSGRVTRHQYQRRPAPRSGRR